VDNAPARESIIDIVTATRLSQADFWNKSALGLSLVRLKGDSRLRGCPSFENRRGLPEVYNERLAASDCAEHVIFVHDDVWLDDYFIADRVLDGLKRFDVLGVAGNRRRHPGQPSWGFIDHKLTWEELEYLSGSVAHGKLPFGAVATWGVVPAECEIMDGVFFAAKRDTLRAHDVRFDPRFDFNLYDVDFCRTAREKGLRLGTWPICITHQSGGRFGTQHWFESYTKYLEKWGS
jgi:GT2 family glycosyltransferase